VQLHFGKFENDFKKIVTVSFITLVGSIYENYFIYCTYYCYIVCAVLVNYTTVLFWQIKIFNNMLQAGIRWQTFASLQHISYLAMQIESMKSNLLNDQLAMFVCYCTLTVRSK